MQVMLHVEMPGLVQTEHLSCQRMNGACCQAATQLHAASPLAFDFFVEEQHVICRTKIPTINSDLWWFIDSSHLVILYS